MSVELTIGIATYDDFDGAWFTVESLRLHHPQWMDHAEILVLDNHPEAPSAEPLSRLAGQIPNVRYVPETTVRSTAVRDLLFRHAHGEIVLVLDSHVLLAPDALDALLAYFRGRPGCRDLVQGPLLSADARGLTGTHWNPVWSEGMYGQWAVDPRGIDPGAEPFDIPMQGLGLFACRRDAWPGLSPRFRGFGGEEGYLHEKVRRAGGRTVCLPALRWLHRFDRPGGVPYRLSWDDRIRNYLIGWTELGLDTAPVRAEFRRLLGPAAEPHLAVVDAELAAAEATPEAAPDDAPEAAPDDAPDDALVGATRRVNYYWLDVELPENPGVLGALAHGGVGVGPATGAVHRITLSPRGVSVDDQEYACPDALAAIECAYRQVHDRVLRAAKADGWVRLHAAVVDVDGRRVLLAGRSGSGKTTLAARLLVDGVAVLSDEGAFVRDGLALPLPRRWHVRQSTLDHVPQLRAAPHNVVLPYDPPLWTVDPADLAGPWPLEPAPVRHVVLLEPRHGGESALVRTGTPAAVGELVAEALPYADRPDRTVRALARLLRDATCHRLSVGTLADAARLVRTLPAAP